MRNLKKITFGIFILLLLLIFQSVSHSEKITKPVTYHYKFAPGGSIDWEKYLPYENAPFAAHFKFLLSPPTFEGEMNADVTLDLDQTDPTLSVQPRPATDGNVGKFESKGGVQIIGNIVVDFSFLPFIDNTTKYEISIFENLENLTNIKGFNKNRIVGMLNEIVGILNKLKGEAWHAETDCQSLLLEEGEFIQLKDVGIRNIFSQKESGLASNKDSAAIEDSVLEISLADAAILAAQTAATGATAGAAAAADAVDVDAKLVKTIQDKLGDAGLKANLGILTPLTFSGGGIYLDGKLATREGQPVAACGLDSDLGFYGLDPESGIYSLSTNYVGNLKMEIYLVVSLDAFVKANPLGITLWTQSWEIAEQRIHITDKEFGLNFEAVEPVTFPVDVDTILETESEFARDFPRLPQWHLADGAKTRLGTGGTSAIAYTPDGCQLAVANNGFISLYNSNVASDEKREFLSRFAEIDSINSLSFSPDGKLLASAGSSLKLWDVGTGTTIATLLRTSPSSKDDIRSVAFSPDGKTLASSGGEGTAVRLWDVDTRTQKAILIDTEAKSVGSAAFSPDGKTLAVAASGHWGAISVKLWDVDSRTQIATLPIGYDYGGFSMSFSPEYADGTIILAVGILNRWGRGGVKLWDVNTQTEITTLIEDVGVSSIVFSPDSKTLAAYIFKEPNPSVISTAWNGTTFASVQESPGGTVNHIMRLWNVDGWYDKWKETRQSPKEIAWQPIGRFLRGLAFSPDSTTLAGVEASGGRASRGRVHLWRVYRGSEKATLTEIATLPGHSSYHHIERIRFSSDGKTLASFDDSGARLWDVDKGSEVATLFQPEGGVEGHLSDFSPDGKMLAIGLIGRAGGTTLELWDIKAAKLTDTLTSNAGTVLSVAFSPDSKLLAGGFRNGVTLWNVEKPSEVVEVVLLPHDSPVTPVAFAPDGKLLAGVGKDGTMLVWDVERKEKIATLSYDFPVSKLAFGGKGKLLAGGHSKRGSTLRLWDVHEQKEIETLSEEHFFTIAFSPDGETFVSCHHGGAVKVWDAGTVALKTTLWANTRDGTRSVAFSPDSKTLATGGTGGSVLLWDLAVIDTGTEIATLPSHGPFTTDVDFSSDGKTLVAAGQHNVYLWNIDDKPTLKTTITPRSSFVNSVRFSRDGETLVIGGGELKLWNIATNTEIATLTGHTDVINSVAFSPPDGKILASGSSDGTVRLWDVEAETLKATFTGHTHSVTSVAFSRDGKILATGSSDGTARLWDIVTETEIATLAEHIAERNSNLQRVGSVAFSPDGKTLASGRDDGAVHLWDVETQTVKAKLTHNRNAYTTVRFSPNGKTLASTNHADAILWDVATGTVKAKLLGNLDGDSICFSPDGKMLAIGGRGDIKLWDITSAVGSTNGAPHLAADVNGDGIVNIQDILAANAEMGKIGDNAADVNGDGIVNIQDRLAIAAAIEADAAAPSIIRHQAAGHLTAADVQYWLTQAQHAKLTDATSQRGILFLQQLLAILTPKETALLPNYPNPFNPETWIPYQLANPADVTLTIYNINGHTVRDLDLGHQRPGMYHSRSRAAYWDGRNQVGEPVASGVYFYTLKTGDFAATRKMLIRK